ncbi:MAG: hypothetical protein ACK5ML_01225 [Lachnospiraceae bacterium]
MKRLLALISAVLLLSLYIFTFVLAFSGSSYAFDSFMASVMMTILIPVLIWVYTSMYRYIKDKKQKNEMDIDPKE